MSSETDELWNEFAAETEDHLANLERLLSDSVGTWSGAEIGALFRYFHSLKGTFLAMGFGNVEAVAHRCEDILSLVRDGILTLDRRLARVLLRAVDRLKAMRDIVLANRRDAEPAADLLAELDRDRRDISSKGSDANAIESQSVPLGEDPEMVVLYSEMLDQKLPQTMKVLSEDADDRQMAAATISELAYGAEMLGLASLSERLTALRRQADEDASNIGEMVGLFNDVREQAKIIEELTGHRTGTDSLAESLRPLLRSYNSATYDKLAAVSADDEPEPKEIVECTDALRVAMVCQDFERLSGVLALLGEHLRSIDALSFQMKDLVTATVKNLGAAIDLGTDLDAQTADALATRWRVKFSADQAASDQTTTVAAMLGAERLDALSSEQISKLEHALNGGCRIIELLLDVESHPEIAGDVLAWLSTAVQAITSHTAHRHGAGCFSFLITTDQSADWIRAQLAALDPEQGCLRDLKVLDQKAGTTSGTDISVAAPRTSLVRVSSDKIDDLMAEIGDMRSTLATFADLLHSSSLGRSIRARNPATDRQESRDLIDGVGADLRNFWELHHALERAHRRIWDIGLQLRVVPVDGLFGRLSRTARDLAEKLRKEVDIVVEGREVRIDKSMVDILIDPLMHMVRNAVDHGLEMPSAREARGKTRRATIIIAARERGNSVEVVIGDDGQGLDPAKIADKAIALGMASPEAVDQMSEREINAFIFRPGFSTASSVSEISGRGVGLDVVETSLQRLGGTIEVESSLGAGTQFTLRLPVSAALLKTLLVEVEGRVFALPERQVIAVQETTDDKIEFAGGQYFVIHRGAAVPVRQLSHALGFGRSETGSIKTSHLVLVSAGPRLLGLSVDRVLRFEDLFLKELHPMLASIPIVAGAAVIGDGSPVLVLDAGSLASFEASERPPLE